MNNLVLEKDLNRVWNVLFSNDESIIQYINPTEYNQFQDYAYEIRRNHFSVNKHQSVAGFKMSEFKLASDLFSLIHPQDLSIVLGFTKQIGQYFINNDVRVNLGITGSKILFRMKGRGGKLYYYLRRARVNGVNDDSRFVSNFSIMDDVSWMKPQNVGAWKLEGAEFAFFDFNVPEISRFKGVISDREVEVLKLLARGFLSRDIAEALKISRHTVDTHRRNMLKKLDVANTPELIDLARDLHLY